MKLIKGAEIAGFIKERQRHAVAGLRQAQGITPQLAIIRTNPDPVVDVYMRLKQAYGEDIGVEVAVYQLAAAQATEKIAELSVDKHVHGIIVQLPLPDRDMTQVVVDSVPAAKDVDGLAVNSDFDPATPTAINWLLAGNNVDLKGQKIVVFGNGRLVGAPLSKIWLASGYDVTTLDKDTKDSGAIIAQADVLVCAAGAPAAIRSSMIKEGAVVIDAAVASDGNSLVGDLADEVYDRQDLTITPKKGGVGPLTISVLFENVIAAARRAGNGKE